MKPIFISDEILIILSHLVDLLAKFSKSRAMERVSCQAQFWFAPYFCRMKSEIFQQNRILENRMHDKLT